VTLLGRDGGGHRCLLPVAQAAIDPDDFYSEGSAACEDRARPSHKNAHTHIFSPFSNVPLLCLYRTTILVKSGHVLGLLATYVSRIGPRSPVAPPGWPSFGRPSRRPGICLPLSVRVAPEAPIILAEATTDADPILPQHIWKTKVTLEVLIFPWMICHHISVP
jgi:hypothetical protein